MRVLYFCFALFGGLTLVFTGAATSAPVTAVATGYGFTCALDNVGSTSCWGDNQNYQLGRYDSDEPSNARPAAPPEGLSSGVTAIAAGGNNGCAIVNGAAKCWGRNDVGQVGVGTGELYAATVPKQVVGLTSGVTAIATETALADYYFLRTYALHTCAVVSGAAKCWGDNSWGILGDGTTTRSLSPVQVAGLSAGVTDIAVGHDHTCGLINGSVQCWGLLFKGPSRADIVPSPKQVEGLTTGATAITAGGSMSCAIVAGAAKCWGQPDEGYGLGDGKSQVSAKPIQVRGLSSGVTDIATDGATSCAVVNGAAKCWGLNNGRLGNLSIKYAKFPVQVRGLNDGVTSIAVGNGHACAVRNGATRCWGANAYQQSGSDVPTVQSLDRVRGIYPFNVRTRPKRSQLAFKLSLRPLTVPSHLWLTTSCRVHGTPGTKSFNETAKLNLTPGTRSKRIALFRQFPSLFKVAKNAWQRKKIRPTFPFECQTYVIPYSGAGQGNTVVVVEGAGGKIAP